MPAAFGAAFLAGYVSISFEVLFFRVYSLATGAAPLVFGVMLSAFLFGVATGSLFGGRWSARHRPGDLQLLTRVALCLFGASLAGYAALPLIALTVSRAHWVLSLPIIVITAAVLGAVLPIVAQFAVTGVLRSGHVVGGLYLSNILGSVAGGLVTGFVLLDKLPMRDVAVLLSVGSALAAIVLSLLMPPRVFRRARFVSACVFATMVYTAAAQPVFSRLHERLQYRRHYRQGQVFQHIVENRSGVVTVTRGGEVFGGGAYDGMISTSLRHDQNAIVRAYAVSAFHPAPRKVLMIGLATGAWAQVVANLPGVEDLTIVEINPGYLELIPHYDEVASLLRNPRTRIVIDDGRRWLNRNRDARFDVIVANTTFHWRAHSTNLLSREYLDLVRRHLAPGGIYYYNTTRSEDALRTGLTVFPEGVRFLNMAVVSERPVGWDSARMRAALTTVRIDGVKILDATRPSDRHLADSIVGLGEAWGAEPLPIETRASVLRRLRHAAIVTDDNMITEWRGAPLRRLLSRIAP